MTTFLLAAILFALLLGLPALRRGLGVLALLALLFVLWATVSNIDDTKQQHERGSPAPRPYRQQ